MNIAMIAARGGSKGIKDKNIISFCGKPLLAWSILQAQQCDAISSVWVTSDSNTILNVAKAYGANTILRPDDLSTDTSSSEDAWLHAFIEIEKRTTHQIDAIVALQATSPLREKKDLNMALENFYMNQRDSLFSATVLDDFLYWTKDPVKGLTSKNYDYKNRGRRQDREKQYLENGSFYIFKPHILIQNKNRLGGQIGMYMMDYWKSFEIDESKDIPLCEAIFNKFILKNLNQEAYVHE